MEQIEKYIKNKLEIAGIMSSDPLISEAITDVKGYIQLLQQHIKLLERVCLEKDDFISSLVEKINDLTKEEQNGEK